MLFFFFFPCNVLYFNDYSNLASITSFPAVTVTWFITNGAIST